MEASIFNNHKDVNVRVQQLSADVSTLKTQFNGLSMSIKKSINTLSGIMIGFKETLSKAFPTTTAVIDTIRVINVDNTHMTNIMPSDLVNNTSLTTTPNPPVTA